MGTVEIRTIWRTATEQCELVFSLVSGYRLRLWVEGRLRIDEYMADAESVIRRGWELRSHAPDKVRG